jgi:hypothetical protein
MHNQITGSCFIIFLPITEQNISTVVRRRSLQFLRNQRHVSWNRGSVNLKDQSKQNIQTCSPVTHL